MLQVATDDAASGIIFGWLSSSDVYPFERMVRIFLLPYLGNLSKSDPCSYERFCLESYILSFPKVLQIPPELPCITGEIFYWGFRKDASYLP